MGGNLFGTRPNDHYFAEDLNAVHESLHALLFKTDAKTFYVGHGGPLQRNDVERRFSTILSS